MRLSKDTSLTRWSRWSALVTSIRTRGLCSPRGRARSLTPPTSGSGPSLPFWRKLGSQASGSTTSGTRVPRCYSRGTPEDSLRDVRTRYGRHNSRHLLPRAPQHAGRCRPRPRRRAALAGCSRGPRVNTGILFSFLRFTCKHKEKGCGPDETRTRDLRHARAALSRLSYGPMMRQQS